MENFPWLEKGPLTFKQALIHMAKLSNVREGFCYHTVTYITSIIPQVQVYKLCIIL